MGNDAANKDGFVSIEVLVAFVVLSLGLAVSVQTISTVARSTRASQDAETRLLAVKRGLAEGRSDGEFHLRAQEDAEVGGGRGAPLDAGGAGLVANGETQ